MSREVAIVAVLEDRQTRATSLPADVRRTIEQPYYQPLRLVVSVYTSDGLPVNLTNQDVVLTIKTATDSSQVVHSVGQAATPSVPRERHVVELDVTVPTRWRPGRYVWDLWLHHADGSRDLILPASVWRIASTTGGATSTP